jgi:hypothetical protein
MVATFALTTDLEGREKGQAIAALARGDLSFEEAEALESGWLDAPDAEDAAEAEDAEEADEAEGADEADEAEDADEAAEAEDADEAEDG